MGATKGALDDPRPWEIHLYQTEWGPRGALNQICVDGQRLSPASIAEDCLGSPEQHRLIRALVAMRRTNTNRAGLQYRYAYTHVFLLDGLRIAWSNRFKPTDIIDIGSQAIAACIRDENANLFR